jgi:hypothetical protein
MDQIKSPIRNGSFAHVQPQSFVGSENNFVYKTKNYETMSVQPNANTNVINSFASLEKVSDTSSSAR